MGLLLASLGMAVAKVKEMDDNALSSFIVSCDKSKHIKAARVAELAKQYECPVEFTSKLTRLKWLLSKLNGQ